MRKQIIKSAIFSAMAGMMVAGNIPEEINGKKVKVIKKGAFKNCDRLTKIEIPNSVTSIGEGAFYDCSSLTEIAIPSSVARIGSCAFVNCNSLKEITIPSSVTNIDEKALGF